MPEQIAPICRRLHEDGFPVPFRGPWVESGVGDLACWMGRPELASAALRIAVIGTREPSPASADAMEAVCTHLVREGAVIVSGAAKGTDLGAHRAALEAGGRTIACLPFGIGFLAGRTASSRHLLSGGQEDVLLLSPFPGSQPPTRQTPVVRNRLIAAFAQAVVVGEAREGSGTYHCVRFAMRLGRPVFVLRAPEEGTPALEQLRHEAVRRNGGRMVEREECLGEALGREVAGRARAFAAGEGQRARAQADLLGDTFPS